MKGFDKYLSEKSNASDFIVEKVSSKEDVSKKLISDVKDSSKRVDGVVGRETERFNRNVSVKRKIDVLKNAGNSQSVSNVVKDGTVQVKAQTKLKESCAKQVVVKNLSENKKEYALGAASIASQGMINALDDVNAVHDELDDDVQDAIDNKQRQARQINRLIKSRKVKKEEEGLKQATIQAKQKVVQTRTKRNVLQNYQKKQAQKASVTGTKSASKVVGKEISKKGISSAVGKKAGASFIGAAGGSILLPVLLGAMALFLAFMFITAAITGSQKENGDGYGNLEGNCLLICMYLREKGVNDVQIAAICGNIFGESGYNPESVEYDENGNEKEGHGLCQWSYDRKNQLYKYAASKEKDWKDINVQLDFLWAELKREGDATSYTNRQLNWSQFEDVSDVEEATKFFEKQFERSLNGCGQNRIDEAKRVYEQLQSGSNADEMTEDGQKIVNACGSTPSPGAGYCAMWVSQVYAKAGMGYPTGNACDMYWKYCHSSDRHDLKVGMIIADPSHTGTGFDGLIYGHVGIYIGDGKVMSNIGYICTQTLDSFISTYGNIYPVKWGWAK